MNNKVLYSMILLNEEHEEVGKLINGFSETTRSFWVDFTNPDKAVKIYREGGMNCEVRIHDPENGDYLIKGGFDKVKNRDRGRFVISGKPEKV